MLLDVELSVVLDTVGHDGSDVVVGNPFGRRCFYDLEIIMAAHELGCHLVPFSRYLEISERRRETLINRQTFVRLLDRYNGLAAGVWHGRHVGHALAWLDRLFLDPSKPEALTHEHLDERFNVEVFYAWVNRPRVS
jgi:hypothetical protein